MLVDHYPAGHAGFRIATEDGRAVVKVARNAPLSQIERIQPHAVCAGLGVVIDVGKLKWRESGNSEVRIGMLGRVLRTLADARDGVEARDRVRLITNHGDAARQGRLGRCLDCLFGRSDPVAHATKQVDRRRQQYLTRSELDYLICLAWITLCDSCNETILDSNADPAQLAIRECRSFENNTRTHLIPLFT